MKLTEEQTAAAVAIVHEASTMTIDGDRRLLLSAIADRLPDERLTDGQAKAAIKCIIKSASVIALFDAEESLFRVGIAHNLTRTYFHEVLAA